MLVSCRACFLGRSPAQATQVAGAGSQAHEFIVTYDLEPWLRMLVCCGGI